MDFIQLDVAIYIVAGILEELQKKVEQKKLKSIQAMARVSAPVENAVKTLNDISQFLLPSTYDHQNSPVPITSYVYATTWLNWAKLRIQNPSHKLFGICGPRLATCPFFAPGTYGCWTKTTRRFAMSVADQYSKSLAKDPNRKLFARGDC